MNRAAYNHYWDFGWLVVNDVYSREEVTEVLALAMDVSQQQLRDNDGSQVVDRDADGRVAPRKINQPFRLDARFRSFALKPQLTKLVAELMDCTAALATDQIFMKPPLFGSAKPYHQDNFYFKCEPADHVLTAWIALDDVDAENGCLRYINGSHLEGVLPHTPIPGEPHNLAPDSALIDRSKEALAIVRAGGVVFHHGLALHGSHRNESTRWRRAYATHWIAPDVTCETDVLRQAYFRQPEWANLFADPRG